MKTPFKVCILFFVLCGLLHAATSQSFTLSVSGTGYTSTISGRVQLLSGTGDWTQLVVVAHSSGHGESVKITDNSSGSGGSPFLTSGQSTDGGNSIVGSAGNSVDVYIVAKNSENQVVYGPYNIGAGSSTPGGGDEEDPPPEPTYNRVSFRLPANPLNFPITYHFWQANEIGVLEEIQSITQPAGDAGGTYSFTAPFDTPVSMTVSMFGVEVERGVWNFTNTGTNSQVTGSYSVNTLAGGNVMVTTSLSTYSNPTAPTINTAGILPTTPLTPSGSASVVWNATGSNSSGALTETTFKQGVQVLRDSFNDITFPTNIGLTTTNSAQLGAIASNTGTVASLLGDTNSRLQGIEGHLEAIKANTASTSANTASTAANTASIAASQSYQEIAESAHREQLPGIFSALTSSASSMHSSYWSASISPYITGATYAPENVGSAGEKSGWPGPVLPLIGTLNFNPFSALPDILTTLGYLHNILLWFIIYFWIRNQIDYIGRFIMELHTVPSHSAPVNLDDLTPAGYVTSRVKRFLSVAFIMGTMIGSVGVVIGLMNTQNLNLGSFTSVLGGTSYITLFHENLKTNPAWGLLLKIFPVGAMIQLLVAHVLFRVATMPVFSFAAFLVRLIS